MSGRYPSRDSSWRQKSKEERSAKKMRTSGESCSISNISDFFASSASATNPPPPSVASLNTVPPNQVYDERTTDVPCPPPAPTLSPQPPKVVVEEADSTSSSAKEEQVPFHYASNVPGLLNVCQAMDVRSYQEVTNWVPIEQERAIQYLTEFSLTEQQAKRSLKASGILHLCIRTMELFFNEFHYGHSLVEPVYKSLMSEWYSRLQVTMEKLYEAEGRPADGNVYLVIPGSPIRVILNKRTIFKVTSVEPPHCAYLKLFGEDSYIKVHDMSISRYLDEV